MENEILNTNTTAGLEENERLDSTYLDSFTEVTQIVYFATLILSSLLLLLTCLVHCLLWDKKNVHGWTLAVFTFVTFGFFLARIGKVVVGLWARNYLNSILCRAIGVALHFFQVALYSWMLILNFDLSLTVRKMTPALEPLEGAKRFFCYCLTGFGIPMVVISLSLLIESLGPSEMVKPGYGQNVCCLSLRGRQFYSLIPTVILFVPNFVFVGVAVKSVWKQRKAGAAGRRRRREMAKLLTKLMTVMGISWILNIASNTANSTDARYTDGWAWFILSCDLYNGVQALSLFWLFVWTNTDLREEVGRKFVSFKEHAAPSSTVTCTWVTKIGKSQFWKVNKNRDDKVRLKSKNASAEENRDDPNNIFVIQVKANVDKDVN